LAEDFLDLALLEGSESDGLRFLDPAASSLSFADFALSFFDFCMAW